MREARYIALDPAHELPAACVTTSLDRARRYVRYWEDRSFSVSYRPPKPGASADLPLAEDFTELTDLAIEAAEFGKVAVVCDELQFVGDPQRPNKAVTTLAMFGAHHGFGVHLYAATRRPAEMQRALTSQADRVYLFQVDEPADVEYVKKRFGNLTLRDGRTVPEATEALREHDFVAIDTRTREVRLHTGSHT